MSQQIVARIRSTYNTPLGAQHGAFLVEVATALGKGLVDKPTGSHIQLSSGQFVSQDVVMDRSGAAWDILSDAEGAASPTFNPIDPIDPSRYVDVSASTSTPPVPAPAPVDLSPVVAALQTLAAGVGSLATLMQQYDEANERRYRDLVAHFDALPKPGPQPVPPQTIPAGHIDIGDLVKLGATIAGMSAKKPAA
jgi:hypothetical protein